MIPENTGFCAEILTRIGPTESEEKIRSMLFALFEDVAFERKGAIIAGKTSFPSDIEKLRMRIFEKRVLDTFRSRLVSNASGNETFLLLHKQALSVGRVSIVDSEEESPLGAVKVVLSANPLFSLIDWLSPETREGIPLRRLPDSESNNKEPTPEEIE